MKGLLQNYSGALVDRRNPNLMPLIDVVFQLILFFLVTSSFTWYSGMKVKLPEATSAVVDRLPETVTLEISRDNSSGTPQRLAVRWWEEKVDGELFFPPKESEDPMAGLSAIRTKLEEYKNSVKEGTTLSVVIAAENSIPYQAVITAIDMCEQLGLSDIVLAIQRSSSPASETGGAKQQARL